MTTNHDLSTTNCEALEDFLMTVDPERLGRGLRMVLLEYLYHQYDQLPHSFKELTVDLQFLFQFLDKLESDGQEVI